MDHLVSKKALEALDSCATTGVWGQYSALHGYWKERAKADFKARKYNLLDTSHHISAVKGKGDPYRVGEFRHANDAAFAEALVNLWRAGRLKYVEG